MASITAPSYLVRQPIESALKKIVADLPANAVVYDIGCGQKPYASLFAKQRYTGVDADKRSAAEIIYNDGNSIPLPDNSADAIICTQTLQHSKNPQQVMDEIYRLLKPGGQALITVPFGIKMVAEPYPTEKGLWRDDYWRFTKYGLLHLAGRFTVVSVEETTGYGGTLCQARNYFVASVFGRFGAPFYLVSNVSGLLIDTLAWYIAQLSSYTKILHETIYLSWTSNYIAILKKPDIDIR